MGMTDFDYNKINNIPGLPSGPVRPWPEAVLSPPLSQRLPVQTEVREPVLHDNHHVADGEEEGSYLQRLRGSSEGLTQTLVPSGPGPS